MCVHKAEESFGYGGHQCKVFMVRCLNHVAEENKKRRKWIKEYGPVDVSTIGQIFKSSNLLQCSPSQVHWVDLKEVRRNKIGLLHHLERSEGLSGVQKTFLLNKWGSNGLHGTKRGSHN
jgi:hypothetical protein